MKSIIYSGTFNPITNGHINLVERARSMFDKVIIAIAYSEKKQPMFSLEQRIELCQQSLAHLDNIEVCGFNTLLVDFAKSKSSNIILRGVRTIADFEYENQMANMNRAMSPDFETVFLTAPGELSHISSTLVREIASMGGDVSDFVPEPVNQALKNTFRN
jgi:pantetheine-phosphate adenylyltransferase